MSAGATPLEPDEADHLLPGLSLDLREDLDAAEEANIGSGLDVLLAELENADLGVDDMLDDLFLRRLHQAFPELVAIAMGFRSPLTWGATTGDPVQARADNLAALRHVDATGDFGPLLAFALT